MISIILFILSAFFNACADAFENENFFESIFKKWDQRFWYKRQSWKHAKKIGGYRIDGWHIAKSLWILCSTTAGVLYVPISYRFMPIDGWFINVALDIGILGAIWILTFNLFYHKIFKIK